MDESDAHSHFTAYTDGLNDDMLKSDTSHDAFNPNDPRYGIEGELHGTKRSHRRENQNSSEQDSSERDDGDNSAPTTVPSASARSRIPSIVVNEPEVSENAGDGQHPPPPTRRSDSSASRLSMPKDSKATRTSTRTHTSTAEPVGHLAPPHAEVNPSDNRTSNSKDSGRARASKQSHMSGVEAVERLVASLQHGSHGSRGSKVRSAEQDAPKNAGTRSFEPTEGGKRLPSDAVQHAHFDVPQDAVSDAQRPDSMHKLPKGFLIHINDIETTGITNRGISYDSTESRKPGTYPILDTWGNFSHWSKDLYGSWGIDSTWKLVTLPFKTSNYSLKMTEHVPWIPDTPIIDVHPREVGVREDEDDPVLLFAKKQGWYLAVGRHPASTRVDGDRRAEAYVGRNHRRREGTETEADIQLRHSMFKKLQEWRGIVYLELCTKREAKRPKHSRKEMRREWQTKFDIERELPAERRSSESRNEVKLAGSVLISTGQELTRVGSGSMAIRPGSKRDQGKTVGRIQIRRVAGP